MKARALLLSAAIGLALLTSGARARELTFEERVNAQEAIERVYYAHQIGAAKPFEEAVPRAVIEKKVLDNLVESVAVEQRRGRRISSEELRLERGRIERNTAMPQRLRELFAALHDDALLIEECLVRPILV